MITAKGRELDPYTLFTKEEFRRAQQIVREANGGTVNKKLIEHVVTPEVMKRIDEATGQENLNTYWAYLLEFLVARSRRAE